MAIILSIPHAVQSIYAVPGTGTLYGTDPFFGDLYEINPITGVASSQTSIFDTADNSFLSSTTALAVDPTDGQMYLGTGNGSPELYKLNPATGAATLVCNLADSDGSILAIEDMDFSSTGRLYASVNTAGGGNGGTDLVLFDKTDCSILSGPDSFGFGGMGAIAFDASDNLFGATTGPNGRLYDLSTLDGSSAVIGSIDQSGGDPKTLTGGLSALEFDVCNGKLLGGTGRGGQLGQGDLVSVNPVTGAATVVGLGGTIIGSSLGALAYDGLVCPVGGEILSINSAALLVAGLQTGAFVLIPAVLSATGIGMYLIKRRFS